MGKENVIYCGDDDNDYSNNNNNKYLFLLKL